MRADLERAMLRRQGMESRHPQQRIALFRRAVIMAEQGTPHSVFAEALKDYEAAVVLLPGCEPVLDPAVQALPGLGGAESP